MQQVGATKGKWWGAFQQIFGQIGMLVSVVNLVFLSITAWQIGIYPMVRDTFGVEPPPFWVFFLALVVLFLIAGGLVYKFALAGYFSFWSDQWWKHDNPQRVEMEKITRQNAIIMKHMGIRDDDDGTLD